jgi:hypothetical protein
VRASICWGNQGMEKVKAVAKQVRSGDLVQGRKMASAAQGMTLIQFGRAEKSIVHPNGRAQVLVRKAAKALSRPGIKREIVFSNPDVCAYSVNPANSAQFIREDFNGTQTIGVVIQGKFQAINPQTALPRQ